MERILPERYATGTQNHRRIKVGVYNSHYVRNFAKTTYEEYLKDKEREPLSMKETVYCGNNKSTQVKIYPKLQQLRDTAAVDEADIPKCDAMRIEYTIKDSRILKSECNFNSDRVVALLSFSRRTLSVILLISLMDGNVGTIENCLQKWTIIERIRTNGQRTSLEIQENTSRSRTEHLYYSTLKMYGQS